MQEAEEKTTDVFYRFRKRDILKENGLRRNGKGRIRMKRAYFNCILLDGTEQMEPAAHKMVLVDGEKITAIVEDTAPCEGYEKVDLKGGYLMPGLINLHVHLAGNGKPSAKPRDNAALVRRILSNGLTRAVAYRLVCSYAKLELLGGVTTIRTVGGLADFDTRCRDDAAKGKILAPRILAANEGISVPGGHMAGSVAVAAHNNAEALAQLRRAGEQGVDLVKLMITGGVLDATQKGTPGELKMKPEMVRAVCDEAHRLGYPVAAHTDKPKPKPLAPPAKIGPRKLTFKEQRELQMLKDELDALPGKMAALEDEQHTLEDRLNDPGFFARDPDGFNATAKRISELDDEQTAALQRWEDVEFRIAELEGKAEDK